MNPTTSTQSPVTNLHVIAYAAIAVIGAMLAALDAGISNGTIPLPHALTPFLPVLIAGLTVATALLPKVTDGPTTLGVKQPPTDLPPAYAIPQQTANASTQPPMQHVVTLQVPPTNGTPPPVMVNAIPAPDLSGAPRSQT